MKLLAKRLEGPTIYLEPMEEQHRQTMFEAANSKEVWDQMPYQAYGDKYHHWHDAALLAKNNQTELPYVMIDKTTHQVLGSTRLYFIVPEHQRAALGHTWLTLTGWEANAYEESHYMMLDYAITQLGFRRIEIYTDALNMMMQTSIRKLGATCDGLLDSHMVREDGSLRQSILFSITQANWPEIKASLEERLKLLNTARA